MTNNQNCLNFKSGQVSNGQLVSLFLLLFCSIIYNATKQISASWDDPFKMDFLSIFHWGMISDILEMFHDRKKSDSQWHEEIIQELGNSFVIRKHGKNCNFHAYCVPLKKSFILSRPQFLHLKILNVQTPHTCTPKIITIWGDVCINSPYCGNHFIVHMCVVIALHTLNLHNVIC